MSELRSAVEALRSELLPELRDARIEEDFAELHRAVELLEAERRGVSQRSTAGGCSSATGTLSAALWLATTFKVARGTAREHVRIAGALEEMPETRRALDAGELSMSAVRVLVQAQRSDPEAFGRSEHFRGSRADPLHTGPTACGGVLARRRGPRTRV